MNHVELLTEFQGRVDEYERFQQFVEKARSQQGKFNSAVVEKVIRDNTEKSAAVASAVGPLVSRMADVIASLRTDLDGVRASRQTTQFSLEELELRQAIGELSDEDFSLESSDIKDSIAKADQRMGDIEGELGKFESLLARWTAVSGSAPPAPAPVAPASASNEGAPAAADDDGEDDDDDFADQELDPVASTATTVFPAGGAPSAPKQPQEVAAIFDDEPVESSGILGDDLDLHDDDSDDVEGGAPAASDAGRKAALIYLEGTADEKVYFFNGDSITIGRGRDNDVQVKNDSKVSRNHCRLVRRGAHFFIEDNKSANGSLVEGELITERRLFGGEEIIIGETFFRFRLLP